MQMIRISAQTHITRACGATSKRYLRLGDFNDFKFGNCVFLVLFSKNDQLCLVENSDQLLIKYLSSAEEGYWPTEIVDYLSGKIGSRVERNQTTVMRICDRWMQEGTTDRRDRSHPPQCTTSREDREIVRKAVTDRSVTSRTLAQQIESVTISFSVCA
ncbi:HTH_Tnp_Tc3_2 domain-containing protein [Trichonephila clavipes]|nr:HTH_Tnp_Tc3_2 domain-containing protein [Trichonephila clavipes]